MPASGGARCMKTRGRWRLSRHGWTPTPSQ
jgi:hypothetical protein